jgi:EAL domain-containing protein (putative c-di-GMP-specific phosphodiesterase class I)/GGDEF domain-containing protein
MKLVNSLFNGRLINLQRFVLVAGVSLALCLVASLVSYGALPSLLIWPASGLALAAVWRFGPLMAFAAATGAIVWATITHQQLSVAFMAAAVCIVGPLVCNALLKHFGEWKPVETGLDRTIRFCSAVLLICAPINATVLSMGSPFFAGDRPALVHVWLAWWLIDSLGQLLIVPLFFAWVGADKSALASDGSNTSRFKPSLEFYHSFFAVSVSVAVASLIFVWAKLPFYSHASLFVLFPMVALLALRADTGKVYLTLFLSVLPLLAARAAAHRYLEIEAMSLDASVIAFSAMIIALLLHSVAVDRRTAFARAAHQAKEDLSTGLLNDRGLIYELSELLADVKRKPFGLIGVHLSNFDSLSELCGNLQAQHVEQSIALGLRKIPTASMIARLSAGRYVLVVESLEVTRVRVLAREVYVLMTAQTFPTENGVLRLSASTGGLQVDDRSVITAEECLTALADALSVAASVREPQLFVEPLSQTMLDARRSHQSRLEEIRDAIRSKRVELYAQPIVQLRNPVARISYEILCRLRSHDGKIIMPAEFLPLAKQAQMAVTLDRIVIQKTFEWLGQHREQLEQTHKCSINLSGITMSDLGIASFIFKQRVMHDIPAGRIVFEITESETIRNPAAATRLVDLLKAEGFGIALDDFGTGLATFEYLKRFAIDYLKIDGSFIRALKANSIDEEIVRATIRIARHLGVITVAEHVHQQSALDLVTALGVDSVQGALYGMPRPLLEVFSPALAQPA